MGTVLFLLATLWVLLGGCAALLVLIDARVLRPHHMRRFVFVLLVAFAGVATRGQSWQWLGWLPMVCASWMTARFVRRASDRARAARMFGRAVS